MTNSQLIDLYTLKPDNNPVFKDIHNRPKFFNNRLHSNLFEPVISNKLLNQGWEPTYPDAKDFAICLSHDIDKIYRFQCKTKIDLFIHLLNLEKKVGFKPRFTKQRIPSIDPQILLEINKEYGINTTFFLLCLTAGDQDFTYTLDEIKDFSRQIGSNEMQLHGGHEAYRNYEQLLIEKSRFETHFNQNTTGYRNHYLKFQVPDTWTNLEKAGFSWDSTVGYPEMAGFRNGMCHPYHPLVNGKFLNLLEIPIIAMDTTLFEYGKLGVEDAYRLLVLLIDIVKENKGAVSILWHNHYLQAPYDTLYKKVISYIQEKNGWLVTCTELVNHWKNKDYGKIINHQIQEFDQTS